MGTKPGRVGQRHSWGSRLRATVLAFACALVGACSHGGEGREPGVASGPNKVSEAAVTTGVVDWERLPEAPSARTEVTSTSAGEKVFVVGGLIEAAGTVPTVEVYDPRARRWERGTDLPVAVNHAMSTTLDGAAYVMGGYLGPGLSRPTERAFALHGGRWQELPPMPEPRAAGGAAVLGGRVYVTGGVGPAGLADTTLVFDPQAGRWETSGGPPTLREHLGVAAAGGRLFAIGGRTGGIGTNVAAVEAYEPDSGQWLRLPDLPTARGGIAATATTNGFIVVPGGEERGGTFEKVEAFDLVAQRWVVLPPLPTPRHGLGVAAVGTVVYVVAGGPQPGYAFSAANEALDLQRLRAVDR